MHFSLTLSPLVFTEHFLYAKICIGALRLRKSFAQEAEMGGGKEEKEKEEGKE